MYILDIMIEMGLHHGQAFPTEDHCTVAKNAALCNPNITDRDTLTAVVQAVITVPENRIRTVTLRDLVNEFRCPDVF